MSPVSKQLISGGTKPVATYSPAVRVGDLVFTAAAAVDHKTAKPLNGTIEQETETTIRNIERNLKAAGTTLGNVAKTTVYLTDMNEFERYDKTYARFFRKAPPARATLGIASLISGLKIEIDAIAIMPLKKKVKRRK